MLEKLKLVEEKLMEIEKALAAEDLYSDPAAAAKLLKEQKELTPVVEAYRAYRRAERDMADAQELMGGDDLEMRELAQAEYEDAKERLAQLEQDIKILLLPKDENDDKNVIVEIRGGVGGEEAALFAHSLYRMYSMYAESKRYAIEVLSLNETELGGVKEISFEVRGWAPGPGSNTKAEPTGFSACLRQNPPAASTPRRLRWRCCLKPRRWRCRSIRPICRSIPTVPAAPADSTSTRRNPPSASRICPLDWWWNARTSAASTKTRTGP